MNQKNLLDVDWSKIPAPIDDGAATHLVVRTARGDASFEVPEVSPPELQAHR